MTSFGYRFHAWLTLHRDWCLSNSSDVHLKPGATRTFGPMTGPGVATVAGESPPG